MTLVLLLMLAQTLPPPTVGSSSGTGWFGPPTSLWVSPGPDGGVVDRIEFTFLLDGGAQQTCTSRSYGVVCGAFMAVAIEPYAYTFVGRYWTADGSVSQWSAPSGPFRYDGTPPTPITLVTISPEPAQGAFRFWPVGSQDTGSGLGSTALSISFEQGPFSSATGFAPPTDAGLTHWLGPGLWTLNFNTWDRVGFYSSGFFRTLAVTSASLEPPPAPRWRARTFPGPVLGLDLGASLAAAAYQLRWSDNDGGTWHARQPGAREDSTVVVAPQPNVWVLASVCQFGAGGGVSEWASAGAATWDTEAPPPPQGLVAFAAGLFEAQVSWSPSVDPQGALVSYQVTAWGSDGGLAQLVDAGGLTAVSLTLGQEVWRIDVTAADEVGNRSAAATTTITLGVGDAGVGDAGEGEAGVGDAGVDDAGVGDTRGGYAGRDGGEPRVLSVGCGCAEIESPILAVAGLLVARWRRGSRRVDRRRAPEPDQ